MFTKIDLIVGAIGIRLSRKFKKIRNQPDIVFVKENLAFGGYTPYEELKKFKINIIIDLRIETPSPDIDSEFFEYYKIGIVDGSVPTNSQIIQIHKIISENELKGKAIFIHCNLGRGRATLVTMSYLLRDGFDWQTAWKKVKQRRFVYLNKKQIRFLKTCGKINN